MDKPATTSQPIHDLIAQRWSPRSFKPDVAVTPEQQLALAEAARWAPSCYGAEPWSYIFCDRHANQEAWDQGLACLAEPNQAWVQSAPLLLFALGRQDFEHNGKPNRWHLYDTGAASISLVLQAEALGLRAHQMGGFDPAAVIKAFQVPDGWDPIAAIAVGTQGQADAIEVDKMREMETAPRARQELGTKFFAGAWGRPLKA